MKNGTSITTYEKEHVLGISYEKCSKCGKVFYIDSLLKSQYRYKYKTKHSSKVKYTCSWSCFRKVCENDKQKKKGHIS